METTIECIPCFIQQGIKVGKMNKLSNEKLEKLTREMLEILAKEDYSKSPPHLAKPIYQKANELIGNSDPYKEIKKFYNNEILKIENDILDIISSSSNKFQAAVKAAILGNIIDFGPGNKVTKEIVLEKIYNMKNLKLEIDKSSELYENLKNSKSLLYIGDNCGEIVFDKILIEIIKQDFPDVKIYFGVRGKPAINDITRIDAKEIEMDKYAEIVDNGDNAPGTVLENISEEFSNILYSVDSVISKGQGNYESLSDIKRDNVFFLFMAKCPPVAEGLKVKQMSLVCTNYY